MRFDRDGAEHARGAAVDALDELRQLSAGLPRDRAVVRLHGHTALAALLGRGSSLAALVTDRLGKPAFPVRALMFDKTRHQNWSLTWHQDRTVVVREKRITAGFGPWTRKAGLLHVAPPIDLLERMLTVRVHLDAVPATNAPLLIAPGSHRMGRVAEADIDAAVRRYGTYACLAEEGDVWMYHTPILHASERAKLPARRRVLQVDYAAETLPGGLHWLGV